MLTQTQAPDRPVEISVAGHEMPILEHRSFARWAGGLAPFFAVLLQFGLIVLVVDQWEIESHALARLMQLAFIGFVIHHLLPLRFRLPFIAALSLVTTTVIVGQIGSSMWIGSLTGRLPLRELVAHLIPWMILGARAGIFISIWAIAVLLFRKSYFKMFGSTWSGERVV